MRATKIQRFGNGYAVDVLEEIDKLTFIADQIELCQRCAVNDLCRIHEKRIRKAAAEFKIPEREVKQ